MDDIDNSNEPLVNENENTAIEPMSEESVSNILGEPGSSQNKSQNDFEMESKVISENDSKRCRSNLKTGAEKTLNSDNDDDIDDDKDPSKRLKLIDIQPNTSSKTNENQEVNKSLEFRKLDSNLKKRNYRKQSDSSELSDEVENKKCPVVEDQTKEKEIANEDSSSSESVEFCEELAESSADSNEANIFTNDWDASGDEHNEEPDVLKKKPSKSNWSIVKEISKRQAGSNNYIPTKFYSSLHAVQRLELMYNLEEHLGPVNSIGFNSKGNLLASGSDDLFITIWNWSIGKKIQSVKSGHKSNVFQSKWLPIDVESYIVTSARDGYVYLMNIVDGRSRKLAAHRGACHKLSIHPDQPHNILSAGEDSKVFSIDVREKKPTTLLSVKENDLEIELYSVDINPLNNSEFCVAGKTKAVKIYDKRKVSVPLYQLYPKHLSSDELSFITAAVYNYNGTEVVASYNDEDIYLFDVNKSYKEGDFAHRYQGHCNNATNKGVNFFGPCSEFILSGSDCGNIFIWDKKTEAIVQWMAGDAQGIVNVLEPHPHIPVLASSGLDYDVKIWIPSNEELTDNRKQLQSCVKKNLNVKFNSLQDRENNFDGHILWFMLQHLNRAQRRRQHLSRRDQHSSNDESSNSSNSDDYASEDLNEDDEGGEESNSNNSENDSSED